MTLGEVQDNMELVSESHYIDSIGSLWVVAEVRNTSDAVLGEPKVTLTIGDVVQEYGTTLSKIEPGDVAPIMLHVSPDDMPQEATEYTLDLMGTEALDDFSKNYYHFYLTVENDAWTEGQFYEQAVGGELVNTGEVPAKQVHVIAAFYDEAGAILYLEDGYIDAELLAPGDRAEFLVEMDDTPGTGASYRLWAEGISVYSQ